MRWEVLEMPRRSLGRGKILQAAAWKARAG